MEQIFKPDELSSPSHRMNLLISLFNFMSRSQRQPCQLCFVENGNSEED